MDKESGNIGSPLWAACFSCSSSVCTQGMFYTQCGGHETGEQYNHKERGLELSPL